ncbi:hypothetical protein L3X38_042301 [Prunus dulcis]|uniref:Uncharacterized protein n=1 Tax=Prunus dulcis TaxID=3755 RepID=A0AAD4UWK7_PRUDU|nr:hypothetical protein L3X38_042301 [Prunus dulcis]
MPRPRQGKSRLGKPRHDKARQGRPRSWHAKARWQGLARQDMPRPRQGKSMLGKARYPNVGQASILMTLEIVIRAGIRLLKDNMCLRGKGIPEDSTNTQGRSYCASTERVRSTYGIRYAIGLQDI